MERYKFPRTPHLPWSPGFTGDDERLADCNHFKHKVIVMTEKLDGENTTIYSDGYIHARSIDSNSSPWQSYIKGQFSYLANELPDGWRIMGENMFAIHSIEYTSLTDYFYVFGIADGNIMLPWDDIEKICSDLGLSVVPVIDIGPWNEFHYRSFGFDKCKSLLGEIIEGYVLRNRDSFFIDEYAQNVAKFVRKEHVQTDEHWTKNWKQAKLKDKS